MREEVNISHSEPSGERIYPIQNNRNGGNASIIQPYVLRDYNEEELKHNSKFGCHTASQPNYCTALIQYNGWAFPKDYLNQVK